MKFLCVPCDQPMKIQSVSPPDRGSISVVYACDACGYEMAMLTNAFETQLVSSLGVKVAPASAVQRMESVPAFVRPMARSGIEKFAEENGYRTIDAKVLDEARSRFGM